MSATRAQFAMARRAARNRRIVWATVTKRPRASIDEIASAARVPRSTVRDALHALRRAGHIDYKDGSRRARTILVPFVMIKKASGCDG